MSSGGARSYREVCKPGQTDVSLRTVADVSQDAVVADAIGRGVFRRFADEAHATEQVEALADEARRVGVVGENLVHGPRAALLVELEALRDDDIMADKAAQEAAFLGTEAGQEVKDAFEQIARIGLINIIPVCL